MSYHFTSNDFIYMQQALNLAKRGMGWTNPHPMVGAVIVKGGKIITRGYHRKFGSNHAEMDALKHAAEETAGATMYVTLEPCHLPYDLSGPRIPCVNIIKQAGIKKAHIAMIDSNPEVAGKGRKALEKAGIQTTLGLLQKDALHLNEAYHHFMANRSPFIAITFSASLDGKIATKTGDSKWITNEKARAFARNLRSQYQAILVGINTILHDDPHLGVRMKGQKDPLRIILDSTLKIPLFSQVLRDDNVLICTTTEAPKEKLYLLQKKGFRLIICGKKIIELPQLLSELAKLKIISILVEGGGKVLGSFVDEKLVDKVYAFYAPLLIGGKDAISISGIGAKTIRDTLRLKDVSYKKIEDNMLTIGYV